MNYVFRDPEELNSVFSARIVVNTLVIECAYFHKGEPLAIEGLEMLARILYRLDQRWFLSMIWDTDELLPVKPELNPFKNSDINPYGTSRVIKS